MRRNKTAGERKSAYEKIADTLSLPKTAAGGATSVTITGMSDITVEGYRGIIHYSENEVCLNAPRYIIKIIGTDLVIKEMADEFINISGTVISVEYGN